MADPNDLKKGNCYFYKGYVDNDLFIPIIETYIFVESGIEEGQKYWLFQDASSYIHKDEEPEYLSVSEDNLYSMIEISELRDQLKGLEHLHPLSGEKENKEVCLSDENRDLINAYINSSEIDKSVTITTAYRDKGVSLKRTTAGIELALFLNCKESPEEEKIIRFIFSENNIEPTQDYLAQHERVRILSYELCDLDVVENIVERIFKEAYKITRNEGLKVN